MPSDSDGEPESDRAIGSTVAEETTRVAAVRYVEGASGHAVLSIGLVLIAGGLLFTGRSGPAAVAVIVAYGIALNGASLYLWDELRLYFHELFDREDSTQTRTLTPHQVSPETKAELASGAAIVGGVTVILGILIALNQTLSLAQLAILAIGGLIVGNIAALWWSYSRT